MQIRKIRAGLISTNTYLLWDEGSKKAAVIDPEGKADRLRSLLAEEGLTLTHILLTHGHFDHIGAAEALSRECGLPVRISEADRELLTDGEKNASLPLLHHSVVCHADTLPLFDGETIEVGNISLTVRASAGHTGGSVMFFTEDAVFTGDTVFADGYGRTDLYSGDAKALAETVKRLSPALAGKTVYPGHGEAIKF